MTEKTIEDLLAAYPSDDEEEVENNENPDPDPEEEQEVTDSPEEKEEEQETPAEEETSEEETVEEETSEEEKEETPPAPEETGAERRKKKSNEYMAEMRQLGKLAKAAGYDNVKDYVEHLRQERSKAEAEAKGIPKETQEEIERLRAENEGYKEAEVAKQKEKVDNHISKGIGDLRSKYGLTDDQIRTFAEQSHSSGFDLGNLNINMVQVYELLNPTEADAVKEEKIRQKVLKEMSKKDSKAPGSVGNVSKKTTGDKNIDDLTREATRFFNKR